MKADRAASTKSWHQTMSLIIGFWKMNGYQGRPGICLRAIITRPQVGRMEVFPSLFPSCFPAVALCNAEPVIKRTAWNEGELQKSGETNHSKKDWQSWELKQRGGRVISLWEVAWHRSVQTCKLHAISFQAPSKSGLAEATGGRTVLICKSFSLSYWSLCFDLGRMTRGLSGQTLWR